MKTQQMADHGAAAPDATAALARELTGALERTTQWAEGYLRIAPKGARYAVAISSCRSDVAIAKEVLAKAKAAR